VQVPFIDLSIAKSHTGNFRVGETGTFTLVVTNRGMLPTSGVTTVQDTLPAGLTPQSAVGAGFSCTISGQTITCTHANVIAPGETRTIVVQVAVGSAAYPAVTNVATVSTPGDAISANNSASDAVLVRLAPGGEVPSNCGIDVRKTHAGNPEPGSEVVYTLSWTTNCSAPLVDVIVTDQIPEVLEVLEASVSDGTVSIDGRTVTVRVPSLPPGPAQTATIRVRLSSTAVSGTLVENTATVEDAFGRRFRASDRFRVRGVVTPRKRCFLRAQRYAAPGRYITYTARHWSLDPGERRLTLEVPQWLSVESVWPPASTVDGELYIWDNLPPTAGKVRITTKVAPDAPDGLLLLATAEVSDSGGSFEVGRCTHESVVRRPQRLFGAIKGNSKIFPGSTMVYGARYRNGVAPISMVIVLPSDVDLVEAVPAPVMQDGNTLYFADLPPPAGMVKLKLVPRVTVPGALLTTAMTVTDATGTVVNGTHTTEIRAR
jgi:uncharacterized repeat protein (TIGR01451 family)